MSFVWGIVLVLLAFVWVVSVADIFRRHLGGGRTAAWLLIVLLLPFAGSLLYWALRKPPTEEVERRTSEERAMRHGAPRPPFDSTRIGS